MEDRYFDNFQWQDDGLPWDEFKWELFMLEQDQKAGRYLKKFTNCKDLPNCEELIARELNWDYEEDEEEDINCPNPEIDCEECPEKDHCEAYICEGYIQETDQKDLEETNGIALTDFRRDPIWKEAYDLAIRLQYLSSSKLDLSSARGPLFELLLNSRMVPAKIAGAFGIGFRVDSIGGNIASHKRALLSTLDCLKALSTLQSAGALPERHCARFRKGFFNIREHLMRRIDELRLLFHKLVEGE